MESDQNIKQNEDSDLARHLKLFGDAKQINQSAIAEIHWNYIMANFEKKISPTEWRQEL